MSKKIFPKEIRTITHSAVECFQECRVKYKYRYINEIVPAEPQTALDFGTAIHTGLESWLKYHIEKQAIEAAMAKAAELGLSLENKLKVQVMLEKYFEKYPEEKFKIIEVEKQFSIPLENPSTGRSSRSFRLMGKVDALVRIDNQYWILEHKTTSDISESYLESLTFKAQTAIYAYAMEKEGYPIIGAIYDILKKPGIQMGQGETDEEFEARKAELIAKSKTGKSNAKKKEAETVDEFMERLRQNIKENFYRREIINLGMQRKKEAIDNLWQAAKDMINPKYYPTTGNCVKFGKVCPYIKLCRNGGKVEECTDLYKTRKAHCELGGDQQ